MDSGKGVPTKTLAEIAYLARSSHRVRILQALVSASGSPRDLRDRTETSKSTCNRILNEFTDRCWARQTVDGEYEATPQAEHVAAQFRPFVESIATIRKLGDDVSLIPPEKFAWGPDRELRLGAHHFAGATVKHKGPQQHGVARAELTEAFGTTSSIYSVSHGPPPRSVGEVLQRRSSDGELSGVVVCTEGLFEYLREHPDHPPDWRDVMESGIEMYRCDGDTPDNLTVTDESTFIWNETTGGTTGVVISTNEAVRMWGIDVVKQHRDHGERIHPTAFD